MKRRLTGVLLVACALLVAETDDAAAARVSDVQNTKHNFSATVAPAGVVREAYATSESQICAFCHTPHHGTDTPRAPIWNRQVEYGATYTPFASGSLDATDLGQPGGKSKLCLSCHDGVLALGAVNVLNRTQSPSIDFTGPGIGAGDTIPQGLGPTTGFTRDLGVDLSNDHPISFTYDSAQAVRDGELWDPAVAAHLGERAPGIKPPLPLEDNKLECISCHDPHVRSDVPGENIKFLRVNRFQAQAPSQGAYDAASDIICLGCHDKSGWAGSAHAQTAVADERYADAAADLREFPRDIRVWQAACLNCHDPHTVQGSRRILREGTDSLLQPHPTIAGAKYKQGGQPAIEEVCYACHADPALPNSAQTLQGQINPSGNPSFEVPDVKTDFNMLRHMPITSTDQPAGAEVHDIGTGSGTERGKDFIEDPVLLGKGVSLNRHAECTDCHNPHRVARTRLFNVDGAATVDAAGTHRHAAADVALNPVGQHSNVASGVLRGAWGVEPVYGSTAFMSDPASFEVKRGDPPSTGNPSPSVGETYLTREYQLCMKCHSNYAYNTPPALGSFGGGTTAGTNSMTDYTNQAMEYQSPDDHKAEGTAATPSGAFSGTDAGGNAVDYVTNNHRSWHPVMKETGRTPAVRGAAASDWLPPFDLGVGTQTMYCTDCHGSSTGSQTAEPNNGENGYPWGPHGSNHNFLLKGDWDRDTGQLTPPSTDNDLCFKCHDWNQYGRNLPPPFTNPAPPNEVKPSGFKANVGGGGSLPFQLLNLHVGHSSMLRSFFGNPLRCTYCHVAVPHGWKNKTFLANLNDVGAEAGLPPGTQVRYTGYLPSGTGRFFQGPYYNGAALKVKNFQRSGEWVHTSCGSAGAPGNGTVGATWMSTGSEACTNLP